MHTTIERSLVTEKSMWNAQIMSVIAVLIATVAFQAPFTLATLPTLTTLTKDEHLYYTVFYRITVICDALAFCSSISSAVLLMYALYGKQEDPLLLKLSLTGLWIALISLLLTFGTCIYVVMAPLKYGGAILIVWIMLSIVPVCIRMMIFRSKKYIFDREDERHLWALLIIIFVNMVLILLFGISFMVEVGMFVGLMVVWIGVSMGPKRLFHSQPHISRDNGLFIWFFSIGSIVNVGCILLLLAPLWETSFNPFRRTVY